MALDNARKFVRMIREDKALTERMKGLTLAEGIAAGAEMGLDFTEDELTEAVKTYVPLDAGELAGVSDGWGQGHRSYSTLNRLFATYCNGNENGPKHDFKLIVHSEDMELFGIPNGPDEYVCKLCGYRKLAS